MTKSKPGRILKSMQQRPFRGCGPVYRWLRLNHQEVLDGFAQTAAPWDTVVASMVRDGVTGQRGAPPNRKSVAKVWERVCRDVAADASARAGARAAKGAREVSPSRLPATWQPPLVAAALSPPTPRLEPRHHTESPAEREEDLPEAVRAKLAALDRQLDWRDRFVNPPKRKD